MANNATAKRLRREAEESARKAAPLAALRTELPAMTARNGYHAPKLQKGRGVRLHPLRDGVIATERNVTKTWKNNPLFTGRMGQGTSISMTTECRRAWVHRPDDGIFRDAITGEVIRTVEMGDDLLPVAKRVTLADDEYARAAVAAQRTAEAKAARKEARESARAIKAGEKALAAGKRAKMREAKSLIGTGANNAITNADCDSLIRVMWAKKGGTPESLKITTAMRREARKVLLAKLKSKSK